MKHIEWDMTIIELEKRLESKEEELKRVLNELEREPNDRERNLLLLDWAELLDEIDFIVTDIQDIKDMTLVEYYEEI
jgi:hypothetical protein